MLDIDHKYVYFVGSVLLFIPYIIIFYKNKESRKFALPLSLVVIPFGILSEHAFFQDYWYPQDIWEANVLGLRVLLSDILFASTLGFNLSFLLPTLLNYKLLEKKINIWVFTVRLLLVHTFLLLLWLFFTNFVNINSIVSAVIGTTLFSIYVLYKKNEMSKIFIGSLLICGLSTFIFYYFLQLLVGSEYLLSVWLLDYKRFSLSVGGINIPLTEVMFGALMGAFYGILIPHLTNGKYVNR